MDDNEVQYAVILYEPENFRQYHQDLTNIISEVNKIPVHDAAKQIVNCGGIVANNLTENAAREIAGELKRSGIYAKVIPSDKIINLPEVEALEKIEIHNDHLVIFVSEKEPETVTWGKIILVTAAKIEHTETTTTVTKQGPSAGTKIVRTGIMLTTGLPIGLGKSKKVKNVEKLQVLKFYMDLFLKKPFRRLRIDTDKFDFTCLKEKMQYNLYGNFRLLISEFKTRAIRSAFNSGALHYLNPQIMKAPDYSSLSDLTREARAIITMQIFKSTETK